MSGVNAAANAPMSNRVGASRSADADPIAAILQVLRRGERFLVCSHARFDGDAVGSTLALGMLLQQMGKQADLVSAGRIPDLYRRLPGAEAIRTAFRMHGFYDAAILLECDGLERTGLRGLDGQFLINIDHHISGRPFAQINWIDPRAASTGEMIFRLARAAGAVLTPEMANCLYTTVLTDTGGFCYGQCASPLSRWLGIWCGPEPTPSPSPSKCIFLCQHRNFCCWEQRCKGLPAKGGRPGCG